VKAASVIHPHSQITPATETIPEFGLNPPVVLNLCPSQSLNPPVVFVSGTLSPAAGHNGAHPRARCTTTMGLLEGSEIAARPYTQADTTPIPEEPIVIRRCNRTAASCLETPSSRHLRPQISHRFQDNDHDGTAVPLRPLQMALEQHRALPGSTD